ncbi:MAG: 2-succinyl-5-enolpyruvyl-6-hydroxy-3-cyclohexene-1-carboxylic-acid synthase [Mariniblastus sp.]|nr:2-succinyl-5-enolpyruvyl-6-hydroxy-3-cyclohexene-1-carboxylic-acid synthase [Mariniblastus sp.]
MIDEIWANFITECCIQNGIDHFFVAPGSRCTPLTLAIARHADAHVIRHYDERGLAFAALGFGKATGRPGVFVCTSGTAVANAYPAVIEAAMEKTPLLLYTADRPPELLGVGANQTIQQQNIFGEYPELFRHMPVPEDQQTEDDPHGLQYLLTELTTGLEAAGKGPVHFNWMFREPFSIDHDDHIKHSAADASQLDIAPGDESKNETCIELTGNTVIALGRCNPEEAEEAQQLAQKLQAPLLADITSGLTQSSFELPTEFSLPAPDTILHLGGRIVSKSWHPWTSSLRDSNTQYFHITPQDLVVNPEHLDLRRFVSPLSDLTDKISGPSTTAEFSCKWQKAANNRDEILKHHLDQATRFSEPAIAYFLSKNCPKSNGLFIGNSMVIRDMDWFSARTSNDPRSVMANRGASGIDGLIATAAGYCAGLRQPTTVLLGDLSALHDLNSLSLAAKSDWPMIILVVNNRGGHIFDLLPVRESAHFEEYFATPHTYQFNSAAEMFGIDYRCIETMDDLSKNYAEALSSNQSVMLELVTHRQQNLEVRQKIREEISKCSVQL